MNQNPNLPTPGEAEGDRATTDADLREKGMSAEAGSAGGGATPPRGANEAGSERSAGNPDSGAALPTPGSAEGTR